MQVIQEAEQWEACLLLLFSDSGLCFLFVFTRQATDSCGVEIGVTSWVLGAESLFAGLVSISIVTWFAQHRDTLL